MSSATASLSRSLSPCLCLAFFCLWDLALALEMSIRRSLVQKSVFRLSFTIESSFPFSSCLSTFPLPPLLRPCLVYLSDKQLETPLGPIILAPSIKIGANCQHVFFFHANGKWKMYQSDKYAASAHAWLGCPIPREGAERLSRLRKWQQFLTKCIWTYFVIFTSHESKLRVKLFLYIWRSIFTVWRCHIATFSLFSVLLLVPVLLLSCSLHSFLTLLFFWNTGNAWQANLLANWECTVLFFCLQNCCSSYTARKAGRRHEVRMV